MYHLDNPRATTFISLLALGLNVAAGSVTRSFYGMAYSPEGAILPNCGATQPNVTRDMIEIAQMTPRIRLYGSDCNQTELVLQGIKDAGNVDLSVWVGVFIDGNDTVYQRQMDILTTAIKKYGTEHIAGITVGNEYLLLSYGDGGSATDPKGVAARTKLLDYVQQTNKTIQGMKLDKPIPIGTSDAGSAITKELCAGVDYVMANVHPWFGHVPIDQAATWTWQFYQDFDVKVCAQAANNPVVYIAEVGWPTKSDSAAAATNGASEASVQNMQSFMDSFVCQANANHTNYFYFEFKDEPWKKVYGGVEPYWGLYDADINMKNVTVPNCPVDSPTGRSVVSKSTTVAAGAKTGATSSPKSGAQVSSAATLAWDSPFFFVFGFKIALLAFFMVL